MDDAKVRGQAAGEHPLHPAGLEQRPKAGRRLAVGLDEGGIGVNARMRALAQDDQRQIDREVGMQRRAWRADVMVVARRRRRARAISALLLGSLSDQLMREAGCPVLVVHQEAQNVGP